MVGTQIDLQKNLAQTEPELQDLLDLFRRDLLLDLNCHHLGTIQTFDPVQQTASVTVNYKKTFFEPDPLTDVYSPVTKDYPLLLDCPVMFLGGGNGVLTFPVTKGDECLVLFNDRNIDNWFNGSSNSPVATPRLHSSADGLALVGLRSLATKVIGFATNAVELRTTDGANKLSVGADSVSIQKGSVKIEVDATKATMVVPGATGTALEINNAGKFKVTNAAGEFVAALIQALQTATAGGFPLVADLSVLTTFKA